MENTTSFQEWLSNAYHNQAAMYRAALNAEIRHTIVIYGHPLPKDVRIKLLQSLKEIEIPVLGNIYGTKSESILKIFNTTPKPNFHKILRDTFNEANI